MRSSILARIPGFRQRIIPEPRVPSRGSQARGTRLATELAWCKARRTREQPPRVAASSAMYFHRTRWENYSTTT